VVASERGAAHLALVDDLTLPELRLALAPRVAEAAQFDGWGDEALEAAARALSVDPDVARLAFPHGAAQMFEAWLDTVDAATAAAFPPERIAALRVRDRIRELVMFRKEHALPVREAVRRGLGLLALPRNAPTGARLLWRTADRLWRLAGDEATDWNHYSKRAILSGVYSATTLVWLDDRTPDLADTRGFLDRRIDEVMRFEKWKAGLGESPYRFSVSRFLGKLRYPER